MKTVTMPTQATIDAKSVFLPNPRNPKMKKTVIFDLDETLIHCVDDPHT